MPIRSIKIKGSHQDIHEIRLKSGKRIKWILFNEELFPQLPFGTRVDIILTFEEKDFLNGVDGVVWATYDPLQIETIQNALMVQDISSEARKLELDEWLMHLLFVPRKADVEKAIDFIWRDDAGMRLQPDWWDPAGGQNESFKKWINGD